MKVINGGNGMGGKETGELTQTNMLAQGGIIAAVYVVLTILFAPISFGAVQIRVAEALTILPMFTPAAVPGLFVGCLIANILGGGIIMDVILGSIATLIGAVLGRMLRAHRWLVPLPAIVSNALIVPLVLRFGYGVNLPIPLLILYIALGEIAGCYVLGQLLAQVLLHYRGKIFGAGDPQ